MKNKKTAEKFVGARLICVQHQIVYGKEGYRGNWERKAETDKDEGRDNRLGDIGRVQER